MVVDLKANEVVVKAGDSDYFSKEEKVPGKLILTNQRIYFKSKIDNKNLFNLEILPQQIKEILYFNTMKIIPNGLNIVMKTGEELRFKIGKRNSWGAALNRIY